MKVSESPERSEQHLQAEEREYFRQITPSLSQSGCKGPLRVSECEMELKFLLRTPDGLEMHHQAVIEESWELGHDTKPRGMSLCPCGMWPCCPPALEKAVLGTPGLVAHPGAPRSLNPCPG